MKKFMTLTSASILLVLLMVDPAFAQVGGLTKVTTLIDSVSTLLRGISIAVVTIAFMWAGYKFLFKHAQLEEVGKILAGGLMIAGSAEFARFLLA